MRKYVIILLTLLFVASCQKSIEERAAQEAEEYTMKLCPTPVQNYARTDSLVFDKATKTFITYNLLFDQLDNAAVINAHKDEIKDVFLNSVRNSTELKAYKDAAFNFRFVGRSASNPMLTLYEYTFTPKDYQ